jgi:small GTP-binding protein
VIGDGAVGKTCLLVRCLRASLFLFRFSDTRSPLAYRSRTRRRSSRRTTSRLSSTTFVTPLETSFGPGFSFGPRFPSFSRVVFGPLTRLSQYVVNLTAGDQNIELGLWDTAGQEEYDRLRPLSYANANVFLLCFSVVSPVSCENITAKWYPELMHFCPDVPFILVGTKLDMREDEETISNLKGMGQSPVTTEQGADLGKKLKAIKYMECSAKTQENLKDVFDEAVRAVLRPRKKKGGCVIL